MGGKSEQTTNQSQTQRTTPYGPAQGLLDSLLSQTGGIGTSPDRTGMVSDAYSQFQSNLAPTAGGQFLDPNSNPFFSQVTQNIGNDVQSRLSSLYAGSGRDPAGAGSFGGNLARGIAEGVAPVFAGQYNNERQNQLNAQGNLFQAGGSTAGLLSGLDQVPLQELLAKLSGVAGIGSAFGTTTGTATGTTTKNMSPIEQFYMGTAGLKNLFGSPKG